VNPSHARFCLNCGAPLEAGRAWQGVRKVVTVIFCDVTGSTALGERLDTESLSRVMASYFDAMRAVIDRHHGVVQKFVGDAVVAVFGVPIVREDDALWAVRAAAAMQEALAGLNDDLARDWGVGLRIRIGVSTGEVMVGDPRLGDALVIGDTVNLATRLEAAARPGEVLLDQRTWHLARDAVVVAPLQDDRLTASGITGPTFRLVDVAPDVLGHARRQDSPLVGREDELQLFDWIRRRSARESTCHLLTVLGAAGVGKSRLVDDAIAVAGEQVTALVGRCLPDAAGSTFWPLAEVVRRAAEVKSADSPDEAQAKLTELLAVAADGPRIADRVGRLIGLEAAPAPAEETGWAVRRFFEVLAARKPLVVVLDDLHLAEPTLLDLIEQVAALARQAPILLVAVARLDLLEQRRHWGGGMPNASTLMLEPLDPNESATLLGHLAGQGTLPPEVRTHIAQTAEGNPLFLEEIVGMLIEEGHLRRQCGGWVVSDLATWTLTTPPTIHAILAARLDRLEPEERAVLERASVIGQAFDPAAVVALSPSSTSTDVRAHLLSLVRKELLRPAEGPLGGWDGFQFHHLLMRDVAYDSIPKQTRAEVHERYADWLGETVGARSREYQEILGYHLERAHRFLAELGPVDAHGRELAGRAASLLASAGRRAIGRGDVPASINLLDRAVALLPADDPARPHLLTQLAEALVLDASFDRAGRLLDEALDAAARTGDEGLRAHATLGQLNLRLDAEPDRSAPGRRPFRDEVQSVLETLERLRDEQGQATAWRLLGLDSYLRCLIGQAEGEFERAIVHARAANDDRQEAINRYVVAQAAFWGPTPVADGIRRCGQIREEAAGNYRLEMAALHTLAGLHAMQGRFDLARELGEASRAIAEELGPNRLAALCSQFLGAVELLAGEPVRAEARLRWGYAILERMGERGLRSELAAGISRALLAQGRDEEALRFGRHSGELAVRDDLYAQVERRGPMARVLAARRSAAEAERLARAAVAMAEQTDMLNMRATALVDLAEVLRLDGRAAEAAPLASEAIALYERKGNLVAAAQASELLGVLRGDG